jgi:hypothetical protein
MASLKELAKSAEVPWHAAYPAVKTASIPTITCKELLRWYEEGKKPGLDFVLVDLRRADHEVCFPFLPLGILFLVRILRHFNAQVTASFPSSQAQHISLLFELVKVQNLKLIVPKGGTIKGSINLPAQSLYPSLPTLYTLFSEAKIPYVIWYCGKLISCIQLPHN